MTQPTVLGRPADQDQYDQQTAVWEQALEAAAVGALLTGISQAVAQAQALIGIGLAAATIRAMLVDKLRSLPVNVSGSVLDRIEQGIELGITQAITGAPGIPAVDVLAAAANTGLEPAAVTAIERLDRQIEAGLNQAVHLAEVLPLDTVADVTSVQAAATKPVNQARAEISWWANHAINSGTVAAAEATDSELVWLAERGACLVCLALSGQMVRPGEEFDVDATFGDRPMPMFPIDDPAPLVQPPRHPHCRCRLRLWSPATAPTGADLPAVLRREAQRSVARGWSQYHTRPTRLSAADRLLAATTRLPKTVVARGRRDVMRGNFSPRHNTILPSLPAGR